MFLQPHMVLSGWEPIKHHIYVIICGYWHRHQLKGNLWITHIFSDFRGANRGSWRAGRAPMRGSSGSGSWVLVQKWVTSFQRSSPNTWTHITSSSTRGTAWFPFIATETQESPRPRFLLFLLWLFRRNLFLRSGLQ